MKPASLAVLGSRRPATLIHASCLKTSTLLSTPTDGWNLFSNSSCNGVFFSWMERRKDQAGAEGSAATSGLHPNETARRQAVMDASFFMVSSRMDSGE